MLESDENRLPASPLGSFCGRAPVFEGLRRHLPASTLAPGLGPSFRSPVLTAALTREPVPAK